MADSNTSLKVVITAEDKASGVFSNMSGKLGKIGDVATTAGKLIGTGLVAAAGAFGALGVASFKAAMEAQQDMAIATKTLQNTFDSLTYGEVSNLKKELGSSTLAFSQIQKAMEEAGNAAVKLAFDDEDASKAFAKLFSVTHDVSKAQGELKIAMDLAAYSGRTLEEATSALTMVHAGGTRVLKEFGIQVKDGTTAAEAMALVQDKVSGSAETMANTMSGRMTQLSIIWGNFKETVGAALLEAVMPFINQLSEWAQRPETQQRIEQLAVGFANFAKQIAPIIEKLLPIFITLMEGAGKVILAVSNFLFKTLPDAIGASIFAVQQMIDKLVGFIQKIDEALSKLKALVSAPSGGTLNPFASNFSLPSWVPKFADGGIVRSPTLAMVGEGGEPEAIIPLSKMAGMGGGITINVYGDVSGNELVQKVEEAIMSKLSLNGKYSF